MPTLRARTPLAAALIATFACAPFALAAGSLRDLEFAAPELYLADVHEPLTTQLPELPNRDAWRRFLDEAAPGTRAWIDRRSGAPAGLATRVPLLPGTGNGNQVSLADVERLVGHPVRAIDPQVAGEVVVAFARQHKGVLAFDPAQLGTPRAESLGEGLWQVYVPQAKDGVPVRAAGLVATLRHGNLVLLGLEGWGDVKVATTPRLDGGEAEEAGFAFVGGRGAGDRILAEPTLELLPWTAAGESDDAPWSGPLGAGYRHRLAWSFAFEREGERGSWELLVDAQEGTVLVLQDRDESADKRHIVGGVYPLTDTEVCTPGHCGQMQSGFPIPFADTGLAGTAAFTDGAGRLDASGAVTTRLQGKFVKVEEACGPISAGTSAGSLNLLGQNGDHACNAPGGFSPGNTAGARTLFYELNKLYETARGWVPGDEFLLDQITARLNFDDRDHGTCNASYSPINKKITMLPDDVFCRPSSENMGVFDHEWGHALDDHDLRKRASDPGEAYADITAAYRLQTSCIGDGFILPGFSACGNTADGTGANARVGDHCTVNCSGVRDIDFGQHDVDGDGQADAEPDTVLGFVCGQCQKPGLGGQRGPCGRAVHCESTPVAQAAWDLVARDLQAAPFKLDRQSAFLIGARLHFQGSRNVGRWFTCNCKRDRAAGCNAGSGYMQWLAADDDNGDLDDGTPHMAALAAAFSRHGIACADQPVRTSGCAGAPTGQASLAAFPGDEQNVLQWSAVPGATRYRVFRSEGVRGCDEGKTLIAEVSGQSFTDTQVLNGRRYCYIVSAGNANDACFARGSSCACTTPRELPFSFACPALLTAPRGGTGSVDCTFSASADFTAGSVLPVCFPSAGSSCVFGQTPVVLAPGQTKTVALLASPQPSLAVGDYPLTATATANAQTVSQTVTLRVENYSIACSPVALTVPPGGNASTTCTVAGPPGLTTGATLACQHAPSGVSCAFNPPTLIGPLGVPATVTLTLNATGAAFPGTHAIDAVATFPGLATVRHTLQANVPTTASDFQVSCAQSSLDLAPGQSVSVPCSVRSLNAFSAGVSLSCGGVSGVSCSVAPSPVTPAAGGVAAVQMQLVVSANHADGDFTLRLTGSSGPLTRFVDLPLHIEDLLP